MIRVLLALSSAVGVFAQDILLPAGPYDPNIPTPAVFFGHHPGDRFTRHHGLESYLRRLEQLSERVKVVAYGTTPEGRTLHLVIVTAPDNHRRLEEIRLQHLRRMEAPFDLPEDQPIPVWLTYSVHGNEASGTEAAVVLLYNLAAGQSSVLDSVLAHEIILIDPETNPDGRERYVHHVAMRQGGKGNSDPLASEHFTPWPGGRWNHYLFDLNRDWAWLTQEESRARVALYRQWMPIFHGDFHEMGAQSTYYFAPPSAPFNRFIDEVTFSKWANVYGRNWAAAFDRQSWRYFTRETFDMHYPGFGDTWPTLNGAVGVTFEQAGGVGIRFQRKDGEILTLKDRLTHHFVTSWTTLLTALENRREHLRDFSQYWKQSMKWDGATRAYVIPKTNHGEHTTRLIENLLRQGIEVYESRGPIAAAKLTDLYGRAVPGHTFDAYVVPMRQARRRLLQAIMEVEQIRNDSLFYDITAWSLPLVLNVECYQSQTDPDVAKLTKIDTLSHVGLFAAAPSPYAYLMDWQQEFAAQAVSGMIRDNLRLSFLTIPVRVGGREYSRGTIIIHPDGRTDSALKRLVEKTSVRIDAVTSGWSESGADLGSDRVRPLLRPKIGLFYGEPVSAPDLGALWHWLDGQGLDYSLLEIDGRRSWESYSVLVFPSSWRSLSNMDKGFVESLREWVDRGGVLITTGSSAFWMSKALSGLTQLTTVADKKVDEKSSSENDADRASKEKWKVMTRFEKEMYEQKTSIPGSVFRIQMDTTHELGYGYPMSRLPVLMTGSNAFHLSSAGYNVGRFDERPLIAGYADTSLVRKLSRTAYLIDEPVGRGHVVVYADDPLFRAFWMTMSRSLVNAMLFLRK